MEQYQLYKFLDLPTPPADLLQGIDLQKKPKMPVKEKRMELGIFVHRRLKNWEDYDYAAAANIRTKNDQFKKWVVDNISNDFVDAGINYTVVVEKPKGLKKVSTGAHTDITRDFTLIYLLQTGGDAPTVFWQEEGKSLLRPPKTQGTDFKVLKEVDRITIPLHTWCIIDSRILHSVENLEKNRVALQVGFLKNHWANIWHTNPDPGLRALGPDYNDPEYDKKYSIY
jgi:hypothetical protein